MCEMAYQNGKSERINGVIKNNYLIHWRPQTEPDLQKGVDRAVYLYNDHKPHKALNYATPLQFEKQLLLLKQQTVDDDRVIGSKFRFLGH